MLYIGIFDASADTEGYSYRQKAEEVMYSWVEEHAGYYGRPQGRGQPIRVSLEEEAYPGYSFNTKLCLHPLYVYDSDYFFETHRWLRCSGNDHRIGFKGDLVLLAYKGRRHGMRGEFVELLRDFIETLPLVGSVFISHRQDVPPYETCPPLDQ